MRLFVFLFWLEFGGGDAFGEEEEGVVAEAVDASGGMGDVSFECAACCHEDFT